MAWVMCKREWNGTFHRTVQRGDAAVRVAFPPGQPVEIADSELEAILPDIGKALRFVTLDVKGRPYVVETAAEAISLVPIAETGPDAGNELTPLEDLSDDDLLRLVDEEKLEIGPDADREAIIAALRLAGVDGVEITDGEVDLSKLSHKELKALAAEQKVDVSKCRSKADLIAALQAPPAKTDNA